MDEVIDVTAVALVTGTVVRLSFSDGKTKLVDLRPLMVGPVFDEIFDTHTFDEVRVDPDAGTIVWPNGADLSPEVLRYDPIDVSADEGLTDQIEAVFQEMMERENAVRTTRSRISVVLLGPGSVNITTPIRPITRSIRAARGSYFIHVTQGDSSHQLSYWAAEDEAREARA